MIQEILKYVVGKAEEKINVDELFANLDGAKVDDLEILEKLRITLQTLKQQQILAWSHSTICSLHSAPTHTKTSTTQ